MPDLELNREYEHPKCRTCGSELTMDLNNDYFCMKSVIHEEKHDDHFPNPFTLVRKDLLKRIRELLTLLNSELIGILGGK